MVAMEVAEMETTIQLLREEVRDLEKRIAAAEAENQMLRERCEVLDELAHTELVRSTQMKQIMSSMSAMLIEGLRKMEDEVVKERATRAEKEARRREQERALEVGSGGLPLFMEQRDKPPVTAPLPPEAEPLGEVETSSRDKLPPPSFESDIETDLEKLAKLGEPDKDKDFR